MDTDEITEDDVIKQAQEIQANVKAVSAKVSPWLWIFSLCGLGLALWNKKQISDMYGNWKKAKAAHK